MKDDFSYLRASMSTPEFGDSLEPTPISSPGEPERIRQRVRIANPQGLHMRPAAAFAQLARQFQSSVVVWHNERQVDGKSWLDLVLLAADSGSELVLEVSGSDARTAFPQLCRLLSAEGSEGLSGALPSN